MFKNKIKIFLGLLVLTLFFSQKVSSNINNSIIISVGNLPVTYLDLIKEMKIISILTNNQIKDTNKEQIKSIAVKSLIKRKIKEIEIIKYDVRNYNKSDLENLILNSSSNINTDKEGLKELMKKNNLKFEEIIKRYEIDLKWNSLIFEIYKNKVNLNMSEIENKIKNELEKNKANKIVLISEIEILLQENNNKNSIKKVMDNIKTIGFGKTAKKFSISESSANDGNIGWIDENKLSKNIYDNVKNLKNNQISKPIYLDQSILIIKKMGEKIIEPNIEKIKDRILAVEKEKKLQMFSNSHFSNLERITQVEFL